MTAFSSTSMRSLTSTSAAILYHPPDITRSCNDPSLLANSSSKKHPKTIPLKSFPTKAQTRRSLLFKPPLPPSSINLSLSAKTLNLLDKTLQNSLSASTISGYSLALTRFLKFCNLENIPLELRFPANEFVLCAFAASNAGQVSGNTVCKYISALKAWHILHDVDWKGGLRLNFILNGVKNLTPLSSRRPPRPPVNITMLLSLIDALNLCDPLDATVAAAASVAFWGQCHLGKLLSSSRTDSSTSSRPSRQNLSTKSPYQQSSSYTLFLPQTKTKRHGESVTLVSQLGSSDPLHLLQNHLQVNHLGSSFPLFAYKTPHGSHILTKRQFIIRCNNVWSKLGYPHTTGHCFRIGGTTELLLSGVPPDVVKAMGRWSSDSFLRYWRSLEDLAPRYAKNLHRSARL
jgi:hypothetical protein